MEDTYAVVNKPRRGGGASGRNSAPQGRTPPPGPRPTSPDTCSLPGSPVHHPAPTGESSPPCKNLVRNLGSPGFTPIPSKKISPQPLGAAYEDVGAAAAPGSAQGLGFNCRIAKPKGPRQPPAEWSRV
ncbi:tyrosine-protein phosphatase non-receptor type 18-like [Struthio camelus]|uniref:tyrosine-protein phosphatase non-receptor type 18-like n=1 Tax=Struthio camelus TaxID=8801 RepID=UPI0036042ADD